VEHVHTELCLTLDAISFYNATLAPSQTCPLAALRERKLHTHASQEPDDSPAASRHGSEGDSAAGQRQSTSLYARRSRCRNSPLTCVVSRLQRRTLVRIR